MMNRPISSTGRGLKECGHSSGFARLNRRSRNHSLIRLYLGPSADLVCSTFGVGATIDLFHSRYFEFLGQKMNKCLILLLSIHDDFILCKCIRSSPGTMVGTCSLAYLPGTLKYRSIIKVLMTGHLCFPAETTTKKVLYTSLADCLGSFF